MTKSARWKMSSGKQKTHLTGVLMILSREQRRKNRELKKQLEAERTKNAVVDDDVDKDAEIEALKREVLELQYRMKEESERYEVIFRLES